VTIGLEALPRHPSLTPLAIIQGFAFQKYKGKRSNLSIRLYMDFKEVNYPTYSPTLKHRAERAKDVKTP
jgi:hypothetical protein